MERVTSLSQERATLKHRLTLLERQLRRTENELAKATTETENRPIGDLTSNSKVRRKRIHLYVVILFCMSFPRNANITHQCHIFIMFSKLLFHSLIDALNLSHPLLYSSFNIIYSRIGATDFSSISQQMELGLHFLLLNYMKFG